MNGKHHHSRAAELSLLTDLGLLALEHKDIARAIDCFEKALALARSLSDKQSEGDILGNLGLALHKANQSEKARLCLEQALGMARTARDRFAEKLALERLAAVKARRGNIPSALNLLDEALILARTLGDRQHEVDLLWHTAIRLSDMGRRQQALSLAQLAVHLLTSQGKPQAAVYAEHLEKYRRAEIEHSHGILGEASLNSSVTVVGGPGIVETAPQPPHSSPSYLRMAITAGQALARFIGSGMKTVAAETFQERLQICADCSYCAGLRCRACGCFIRLKARLPHENCSLGRWSGRRQ